jgi:hypothetical protein
LDGCNNEEAVKVSANFVYLINKNKDKAQLQLSSIKLAKKWAEKIIEVS